MDKAREKAEKERDEARAEVARLREQCEKAEARLSNVMNVTYGKKNIQKNKKV